MKPRLLDLFCGAGGAAMGYARAGFEVVGVDIDPQPNYPFEFRQADALEFLECGGWLGFDAIHASPPCQAFSQATNNLWGKDHAATHPDLIDPTRIRLDNIGLPYVIENVPGAPLRAQLLLCGTMFSDTNIRWHRYFEGNWPMPLAPFSCGDHSTVYNPWKGERGVRTHIKHQDATGITWMPAVGGATRKAHRGGDIGLAIPPAYTEYIGKALMVHLQMRVAA